MPALAAVHAAATIARIRARILTLSTRGVYRGSPEMGAWAEVPRSGTRPRTWRDPTAERRPGSQFPRLTRSPVPAPDRSPVPAPDRSPVPAPDRSPVPAPDRIPGTNRPRRHGGAAREDAGPAR